MSGLNAEDIQGDVIHRMPKNYEKFVFFHIENPEAFRATIPKLLELNPPATGASVAKVRKELATRDKSEGKKSNSLFNIGFSKAGLSTLDIDYRLLGDDHFNRGQLAEAEELGDPMVEQEDGTRVPDWESTFMKLEQDQQIHGIILIAGEKDDIDIHETEVLETLKDTISVPYKMEGNTLKDRGTEHFGWMDGISNPAVLGFTDLDEAIPAGTHIISPGVLLLGAQGDPNQSNRPEWALGGSFMVFRKLQQYVPEFRQFLEEEAIKRVANPTNPDEVKQARRYLCAQLFGRWKKGAPLEKTMDPEDPFWTNKENRNNFVFEQHVENPRCPYGAHIRKTNPRNDIDKDAVLASSIMRTGIPYGDEVGPEEDKTTSKERGLAFVAYQSCIENGFWQQQKHWANNPKFPDVCPAGADEPGFDGIIGQNNGAKREGIFGIGLKDFVKPRAGSYFFVPSIKGLEQISKGINVSP